MKQKNKKTYVQMLRKIVLISLLVITGNFLSNAQPVHAERVISACETKSTNKGELGPAFSFEIPGVNGVNSTASGDEIIVTPPVTCCCLWQDFPQGQPKDTVYTSCPDSCQTLKKGEPLKRENYTPAPTTSDLRPDTSSPYYPLTGISDIISKWYAAMFYLAVVLAIIQIFRGGIEYAIAAGNSSKTEDAKAIIVEAVIGLGVALLAAAILVFLRGPGVFTFNP